MLRIRLQRAGKKNQPFFRMVVIERKSPPKGGRPVEVVGFYNPLTKEKGLKEERIKHWLSVGTQPSDAVHNMLVTVGIIKGDKIDVHKKAKAGQKEPAQVAAKPAVIEAEVETQETAVEAPDEKQEQKAEKTEDQKPEEEESEEVKPEKEKSEEKEPEEVKTEKTKIEEEETKGDELNEEKQEAEKQESEGKGIDKKE